jgi:hypothetical protein
VKSLDEETDHQHRHCLEYDERRASGRDERFSNVRLTWNQGYYTWKIEVKTWLPRQVNQHRQRLRDDVSIWASAPGNAVTQLNNDCGVIASEQELDGINGWQGRGEGLTKCKRHGGTIGRFEGTRVLLVDYDWRRVLPTLAAETIRMSVIRDEDKKGLLGRLRFHRNLLSKETTGLVSPRNYAYMVSA